MADLEPRNIVKDVAAVRIIHGVDLAFAEGEVAVFMGPSGCGKSTLLHWWDRGNRSTATPFATWGYRANNE